MKTAAIFVAAVFLFERCIKDVSWMIERCMEVTWKMLGRCIVTGSSMVSFSYYY